MGPINNPIMPKARTPPSRRKKHEQRVKFDTAAEHDRPDDIIGRRDHRRAPSRQKDRLAPVPNGEQI